MQAVFIGLSPSMSRLIAGVCRRVGRPAGNRAWPRAEDVLQNAAARIDDETGPGRETGLDDDIGRTADTASSGRIALADQIATLIKRLHHLGIHDLQSDRSALTDCNTLLTEIASDEADGHAVALSVALDQGRAGTGIAVQLNMRGFLRIGDRDECQLGQDG